MLLEIIDLDKLRRGILYTLIMLAVLAVQEMVLSRISLFGVKAFIVPIFPVAVAVLQGGWWGLGFSLACGMLCDTMLAETRVLFTMLLPALAFMATAAEKFLISRRLVAVFTASVCALFLTAFMQGLRVVVLYDAQFLPVLRSAVLQVIYGVPFIFPIYYACRALSERALD